MEHVVVIGAGQAGFSIVARLRAKGFDGALTLVGAEPDAPYQRPPLSKKYLTGEMTRDRLLLRPESFYADQRITLKTGCPVLSIDRDAHEIRTEADTQSYDKLVLATGSQPRHLPQAIGGDLAGVYYVRSLCDIDKLRPEIRQGAKLLIIGGGYIGLETAAVATSLGVDTTVIEAAPRILQRVAAPETSDYFRTLHTSRGVTLIEGAGLERMTGTDRVTGAVLTDGRNVAADFVVAGIGVLPCTALAEASWLDVDNGICVDDYGRTSDPDIFAVGDCASFPHAQGRLRLESVPHAIDHANAVADTIMGQQTTYRAKPWFWSDQFDVKLQIAGLNKGYERVVTRPGTQPGSISIWYFRDDRLIAVDAANDPAAYMTGKRWIEKEQSPTPSDIAETTKPLKEIDVS